MTSVFSDWLTSPLLFCSLYICDTTRMVWADQYQRTKNFSCQHLGIAKYNLILNLNLKHLPTKLCIFTEALLNHFTSLWTSATLSVWYSQLPSNKPQKNPPFNMTSSCILGFQVTGPATFYSSSVYCTLANRKVFLRQITAGCKHNSAQLDKWLEILAVEVLTAKER